MQIAVLTDKSAPFYTGGYEGRLFNLAIQLAQKHDVRIFTSLPHEATPHFQAQFCPLVRTPPWIGRSESRSIIMTLAYAAALTRCPWRGWEPDVVIVEAIPYVHVLAALPWLRRTKSAVVLMVDEAWPKVDLKRQREPILHRMLVAFVLHFATRVASMVVTPSGATARSLRQHYGVRNPVVVPNGIDIDRIPRTQGKGSGPPSADFISVGRIVKEKRFDQYLGALSVLKEEFGWSGRARLVGDGPELGSLRKLARASKIEGQLEFVGHVSDDVKFQLLGNSKIFVLSSPREGFSISTLEAMSCGLPVVCAKPERAEFFGVSDLVAHDVNGLHYSAESTRDLAVALARILKDQVLLRRLAGASLDRARGFGWKEISREFERAIGRVVTQGSRSQGAL